jgi:glycerophosphoryl diester phosphodiesterase
VTARAFPDDAFPAVVAHRGTPASRPENTLASFEEAVRIGARVVEFDVRLARDGEPVVMHDPTVDRTTDGSGAVHELGLAEIRALDAGDGERVPLLAEVLEAMSGRAAVAVEIKNLPGEPAYDPRDEPIVTQVHDALRATAFVGPVLVIAFNPKSLEASRAIDSEVPTGFLTTTLVPPDEALGYAVQAGHQLVLPGTEALEPVGSAFAERAHAAGVRVGTWTTDTREDVERFIRIGVDVIASNDPAMALDVLGRRT